MKKFLIVLCAFLIFLLGVFLDVENKFKPITPASVSTYSSDKNLNFPSRYAYHRANNLKTLKRIKRKFKSIETDVFYINQEFSVAHDEEELSSITLDDWLNVFSAPIEHNFWIDLKTETHSPQMAKDLAIVFERHALSKSAAVVETSSVETAKMLEEEGFYTALGVYGFDTASTPEEYQNLIKETEARLQAAGAVSMAVSLGKYHYVKYAFPNTEKIVYYKTLNIPFNFKRFLIKKKLLKDPSVKLFILN